MYPVCGFFSLNVIQIALIGPETTVITLADNPCRAIGEKRMRRKEKETEIEKKKRGYKEKKLREKAKRGEEKKLQCPSETDECVHRGLTNCLRCL